MALTRSETGALAIAVVAHIALIGALSLTWRGADVPPGPERMEVDLIAESAPTSTAPVLSPTPPAPALGTPDEPAVTPEPPLPDPAPPEPLVRALPEPPSPKAAPPPKVAPKPPPKAAPKTPPKATTPKPAAKPATRAPATKAPAAKSPPAKTATPRPTGRLDGIVTGLNRDAAPTATKGAPAAATAAEVKKSIDVSIKGAVRSPWNRCQVTGLDVDQLSTEVRFRLTRSGALDAITGVRTTGQTDTNRTQVARHQECARRAIELAAPFDLPVENYSVWRDYVLDFVKR